MQGLEIKIYDLLARAEATVGLGSSETANNLIEVAKPFYKAADESGKANVVNRLNALRDEPGVPLPENLKDVLGN